MGTSIKGKRILFFSPSFFSYENVIADKMRELGGEVDFFDVRSITSATDRAILKVFPQAFKHRTIKYYDNILSRIKNVDYDYVLIVKCDMTPIEILMRIKRMFPNARLCLYLWDSVENIPGITEKFKFFDSIHSFDLSDCKIYKSLQFRPLFFSDQYRKKDKNSEYKYDICFIGTIHSDRYAVVRQIQKNAAKIGLKCYWFLYLQSPFMYYFYKQFKREFSGTKRGFFNYRKMSAEEIVEIVDSSKIILDIQHPKQNGLTMRTIEMIGMNKKLITTNASITDYDLFDENNITVVDRKNIKIQRNFFREDYRPLPQDIYEKYSITAWIYDVLS